VVVDRLATGDLQQPTAQVGVAAQVRVGTQCGDARLLEAVVGIDRADGGDEEAVHDSAMAVEQDLERREAHTSLTLAGRVL
jgi:hypothetical protein